MHYAPAVRFLYKCQADFNTIPIMQLRLPEPSSDAQKASQALRALIADDIRHSSGWIPFSRYMELALYAPGLGYYSGGSAKFGKDGDFTTAPEITPLFGQTVAHAAAGLLPQCAPRLMEFGAGNGKLAFDILTELAALDMSPQVYLIVDVSGELRARQEQLLEGFSQVRWLDRMPAAFSGVVIGNEVLDAMPVNLVIKTEQGWRERGIGLANPAGDSFVYQDRPCPPALVAQIPEPDTLPVGYLTEVHPVASGFMRSLADMLAAGHAGTGLGGAALLFDYGFPAHEYYLGQRSQGTLMCHYRHHAHDDPLFLPGLQDITAHVDFTAMARAALDGGMELLGYTSQAAFLLDAGIGELLLRTPPDDALHFLPQSNAVQKLLSPAEMGELFKVLVIGKAVSLPEQFSRSDRSSRL
jgi:SAM-dependent MidA family methyltransferase